MRPCRTRIPVFADGNNCGTPYTYVDVAIASEWVASGLAKPTSKRGKSITLYARKLIQLRGQSCKITLHILIEALCGSRYHQSLVDGWSHGPERAA